MSIHRILSMMLKDLRLGPRSPIFLWTLAMPILTTFLIQIVFLPLFEPLPRLGIVDLGGSEITAAVREMKGIDLTLVESPGQLRALVESNDVDAGLVLSERFDEAVRGGERPELRFYVSGESLLSNRLVLVVTAIDLVRDVEDREAPVNVVLKRVGDGDSLPLSKLLVLLIVLFVLIMSGMFVPGFSLVEEREHGTLSAILVTPAKMKEVLLSKGGVGFLMTMVMCYATLAINGALSAEPVALLITLAIAALICIEIGLVYGTAAKDAKTLYTLVKSLNIFFIGPVIFYLFPDWPQWIAKLFPTYWFIDPLYQIALKGASLSDVWTKLAVALGIGALLLVPIGFLARRMQAKLAAA